MNISTTSGTYALTLHNTVEQRIRIGSLGIHTFAPGYYTYIGSAFGPGGLRVRLTRHLKAYKSCRWHIDYLRQHTSPAGVYYAEDERCECEWAHMFTGSAGVSIPVKGFGSSDCKCEAHLFYTNHRPDPTWSEAKFTEIITEDK